FKPSFVFSENVLPAVYGTIQSKYKAACIPMIDIFGMPIPQPAPKYGAEHLQNGVIVGQTVSKIIAKNGWPGKDIWIVMCGDSKVATGPGSAVDMLTGFRDVVAKKFGVPANQISQILECPADQGSEGARVAVTDWLTAHPQAKYVAAIAWT